MKLIKKTSLESSEDVADTLTWKLQKIEEAKLPTESGIADYIALAIQNLNKEIEYIKSIEAEYKEQSDALKEQIEAIKVQGAKFFNDAGIVKIEGVICSSITLTKGKEIETTETIKKVFTPLISKAEIEELLIGLGKAEMKTITESKTSNFVPQKLTINSRKKNAPKS
ncbi:hypothetical protein KAU11_06680 [Candidatus Babeliales bacterium]|nr:hypothetical protein [Candidatus Babeliales bacterium]